MTDQLQPTPILAMDERIAKSSQICFFAFDEASSELRVIFRTNPALYAYLNFPRDEFERVVAEEPSLGSYLLRRVSRRPKGGGDLPYRFEKRELTAEQRAMWDAAGVAQTKEAFSVSGRA